MSALRSVKFSLNMNSFFMLGDLEQRRHDRNMVKQDITALTNSDFQRATAIRVTCDKAAALPELVQAGD